MKNFFKLGGIGVAILLFFTVACCNKIPISSNEDKKIDTSLVLFENDKQLQAQVVLLRQFDSLSMLIHKQSKIIDSLNSAKSIIQYKDKIVYKETLSSKYNDKQIDSIIQSNINLRNIIKHQNIMKK